METISVEFKYELENGGTRIVKVNDVSPLATESEITALGDSLIELRGHYKGSKFTKLLSSAKIVTIRETF
ncbi:MAG: hypothetical protein FWC47_04330 [Oscillospiraceae bacterium]|nr:hypothetical protein [Oscillospiraceae bacterium]